MSGWEINTSDIKFVDPELPWAPVWMGQPAQEEIVPVDWRNFENFFDCSLTKSSDDEHVKNPNVRKPISVERKSSEKPTDLLLEVTSICQKNEQKKPRKNPAELHWHQKGGEI